MRSAELVVLKRCERRGILKWLAGFVKDHLLGMFLFALLTGIAGNYVYDALKRQAERPNREAGAKAAVATGDAAVPSAPMAVSQPGVTRQEVAPSKPPLVIDESAVSISEISENGDAVSVVGLATTGAVVRNLYGPKSRSAGIPHLLVRDVLVLGSDDGESLVHLESGEREFIPDTKSCSVFAGLRTEPLVFYLCENGKIV